MLSYRFVDDEILLLTHAGLLRVADLQAARSMIAQAPPVRVVIFEIIETMLPADSLHLLDEARHLVDEMQGLELIAFVMPTSQEIRQRVWRWYGGEHPRDKICFADTLDAAIRTCRQQVN